MPTAKFVHDAIDGVVHHAWVRVRGDFVSGTVTADHEYHTTTPILDTQGQPKTPAMLKAELIADVQRQRASLNTKPSSLSLAGQSVQI